MDARGIDVAIVTMADSHEVAALYKDAGWWRDDYDEDFIPAMIAGSFRFAAAYDDGRLVGMGRAISDGVSDAYIQDVVVLGEYRGRGIGVRLVGLLTDSLHAAGIDWIGLIGEPGTGDFYRRLGFEDMPGYLPMRMEGGGHV